MTKYTISTESEFEISIESPIHIGSGDKLDSLDFVVQNGKVSVIEFDKVLSEMKNKEMDTLILYDEIEQFGKRFDFRKFLGRYRIDIGEVSKYFLSYQKAPRGSIMTFLKDAFNTPLIPGSSIKGAIRTALAWYFLKDEDTARIEKVLRNPNEFRKEKGKKIEDLIFYGKEREPNFDLNKAISITDAYLQSYDQLEVVPCKVFTTTRENTLRLRNTFFLEAVMPSPQIGMTKISLNQYFLKVKSSELGFKKEKVNLLKKFPEICNEFSKELIECELEFFENYGLSELVQFYKELLRVFPQTNKEFLLKLGSGTGWISMTIGLLLRKNPCLLKDIRKEFRLGKRRNSPFYVEEFPKTRKIIAELDKPKYPMGWVRFKEII